MSSPQFHGVPVESLALVRVQGGLDGCRLNAHGDLVMSRIGSGRADDMNSFHFALNGVVSNHAYGAFDHPYVIISPLTETCQRLGNKPSGIGTADTWFHADAHSEMTLAKPTILAPAGSKVPEALWGNVEFYPPGYTQAEMLANRNTAANAKLEEMGLSVRSVGMHGWAEERMLDADKFKDVAQALGVPHLESNNHTNSADNHFAIAMSTLRVSLDSFEAGERVYTDGSGAELDLVDRCRLQLQNMHLEAERQFAQVGDVNAYGFHQRRIEVFAGRVASANSVCAAERATRERDYDTSTMMPPPLPRSGDWTGNPAPAQSRPPPLPPSLPPPLPSPMSMMRSPGLGSSMFGTVAKPADSPPKLHVEIPTPELPPAPSRFRPG